MALHAVDRYTTKAGCYDLFDDSLSVELRDLGLECNTDADLDEKTFQRIQFMMRDIIVPRFAGNIFQKRPEENRIKLFHEKKK